MKESIKQTVQQRAQFCCEYCLAQANISADSFVMEHILPVAKGGSNHLDNLAYSCQRCNNHKFTATHALDEVTGTTAPLYNPRDEVWENHFEWSDDFTEILGKSPTGRATVNRLKLNRVNLVNLRRILVKLGLHPPF
ncbi:MAG: hypothetical protein RLZZ628_2949 [Bacteroidota bacterium]|jgi:hypothetical protein